MHLYSIWLQYCIITSMYSTCPTVSEYNIVLLPLWTPPFPPSLSTILYYYLCELRLYRLCVQYCSITSVNSACTVSEYNILFVLSFPDHCRLRVSSKGQNLKLLFETGEVTGSFTLIYDKRRLKKLICEYNLYRIYKEFCRFLALLAFKDLIYCNLSITNI